MRRLGHQTFSPLIQSQRRHAVPAVTHGLAVRLESHRHALHQLENLPRPRDRIRNGRGPQTAFRRRQGHALVDLDLDQSEEHTSELQSRLQLVCRLLLAKTKPNSATPRLLWQITPAEERTAAPCSR